MAVPARIRAIVAAPGGQLQGLAYLLRNLCLDTPGLRAAVLISSEGLVVAGAVSAGVDEDRLGALGALFLTLGDRLNVELGTGIPEQFYLKGGMGAVVVTGAGSECMLVALLENEAKLGLVLLELRRIAVRLPAWLFA